MRHAGFPALGADAQLRQLQCAVVSSPHALSALGRFAFRDAHKSIYSFSLFNSAQAREAGTDPPAELFFFVFGG